MFCWLLFLLRRNPLTPVIELAFTQIYGTGNPVNRFIFFFISLRLSLMDPGRRAALLFLHFLNVLFQTGAMIIQRRQLPINVSICVCFGSPKKQHQGAVEFTWGANFKSGSFPPSPHSRDMTTEFNTRLYTLTKGHAYLATS